MSDTNETSIAPTATSENNATNETTTDAETKPAKNGGRRTRRPNGNGRRRGRGERKTAPAGGDAAKPETAANGRRGAGAAPNRRRGRSVQKNGHRQAWESTDESERAAFVSAQEVRADTPNVTNLLNLADTRLGAEVLGCSDDFFAESTNLLKNETPVFIADKYTDRGKWMDGWESRRHNQNGHDWAVVKLGVAGHIVAVDIDTAHFTGNHAPYASLEACKAAPDAKVDALTDWKVIVPRVKLHPGSQHLLTGTGIQLWTSFSGQAPRNADEALAQSVAKAAQAGTNVSVDPRALKATAETYTHVRLRMYPDGGIARLRVYGAASPDFSSAATDTVIDVAAAENGGRAVLCSNSYFSHMGNLLMPGRGVSMADGWETKRRLERGDVDTKDLWDWIVIRLGAPAYVKKVVIDTAHFKGNFPQSVEIDGLLVRRDPMRPNKLPWTTLIERTPTTAHNVHEYEGDVVKTTEEPHSHIRVKIFPDGGISRVRVFGAVASEEDVAAHWHKRPRRGVKKESTDVAPAAADEESTEDATATEATDAKADE